MELIYQILATPTSGMRQALKGRKVSLACLVVILAILSDRIGWLLMLSTPPYQAKLLLSIGLVINWILTFGSLFFLTALFHLAANLSGGSGKVSSLYTVFSLSLIPFWMITPLAITLRLWGGGLFLFLSLWITILGWIAALFILGIREVYYFSWGKAVATFVLPLAGIGIALVILFVLLLTFLFLSIAALIRSFPLALGP